MGRRVLLLWAVLAVGLTAAGGRADPPKEPAKREEGRVKTTTVGVSPSHYQEGVVAKIDADGLTLVELREFGEEPREHRFLPIDQLREGGMLETVTKRYAYRWEDVKVGDTVELRVAKDHIDKQMYCLEIKITRRPKGKLPESQKDDPDFPASA